MIIHGIFLIPHFVSSSEESDIVNKLDGERRSRWRREHGSRPAQHYGAHYDYVARTLASAPPIPAWATDFCARVWDLGVFPRKPDQLIANDYPEAIDGIDPHIDHPTCFGPAVASLSLLSSTVMTFRFKDKDGEPFTVLLEPRSLLLLSGQARFDWHHEIPKKPTHLASIDLAVTKRRRVSLTFRTIEWPTVKED